MRETIRYLPWSREEESNLSKLVADKKYGSVEAVIDAVSTSTGAKESRTNKDLALIRADNRYDACGIIRPF